MNVRLQRTIANWRWWVILPVMIVLFPLAIVSMLAEGMGDALAKITNVLMRWSRTT